MWKFRRSVKTLYAGKNSRGGNYDWVDSPPKTLSKKVAKAHDRVALKVFKIPDCSKPTISGRTPLKIHAVDIQSPYLVSALKDIVKEEGVNLEVSETAHFQEPFKPLFFCYDKILSLSQSTTEAIAAEHLVLLVTVLNEIFGDLMRTLSNLKKSRLISYPLAWTHFPHGSLVYSSASECARVCRVKSTQYESDQHEGNRLALNCEEIAFDGKTFAWRPLRLLIPEFRGNQQVDSLPNFLFDFHLEKEKVERRLRERAVRVLEYQELCYKEYEGVALFTAGCKGLRYNVSGRILIDHHGYNKHHEGFQRLENNTAGNTSGSDGKEKSAYLEPLTKEQQKANKETMLAREQDLIFVTPILEGFALKNKVWLNFFVDDIKPINWNDDAYDHLVYHEEQKDLVLSFVDNHKRLRHGVHDVIIGKGQGLIVLLSGPPGTGKTLTAEAIADKTRRPLYYLQAEDLGTNPAVLGSKIKKVFEMATEWDAVILLDEADVFMAQRSPADITRNELVSIFLRELEYFQGIIFLTTNLYSTIDVAFRSRVHIHLLFDPLSFSSRRILWEKFLARLPATELPPAQSEDAQGGIGKDALTELAKWDLNGREIKNSIKTVRTWCVCKGVGLNLSRLESGIRVTAPQARKVEGEA
ncbi:hypothetical protein OIDMADRAFT_104143 [Oidiodendron maius Zn]|uniref:AAA+ ATPase domain-containing protein n=1 Tax=Oidiodendron maius (strain Zn) TaxID=913774 RepID=A0A0C3CMG4_OIDMZ|nr:hypothetical protein OIDMADRAFT_104143 [Oidiodendron maius Zn]